ncbi:hamartin [Galendromus occidentalis]|uniref:Hamartin n=1 Tax=Galendromus occidentalis TaxID=34638 RepID=A0AAJ7L870_9ACAR|nr:hamartin [Galendromus occidentalis]
MPVGALELLRSVDDPNSDLQDLQLAVHEYLQQNKDKEFVHQLIALYLRSRSVRVLTLLISLRDPFYKWMLDRCSENIRQNEATIRIPTLKLLLSIVQKDPSWLHDNHVRILREASGIIKEGQDVTACFVSIVIMASILPLIPGAFDRRALESLMFRAFAYAADLCVKRKDDFAELNRQHLCSGLYTLYKVLYSMFPCNFLAFLRTTYGSSDRPEYKPAWGQIIWPMIKRTYFHPFLVQYNCDSETHKDRWKGLQKHDIIADCQNYFSDPRTERQVETGQPRVAASKPCSIPKRNDFIQDAPSSDGVLGKTPNLLDVMTPHPPSDVSSSLGSVDIAEEANPEEPTNRSDYEGSGTPQRPKRHRRSSVNLAPIPAEATEDERLTDAEDHGFCLTTQRLTQEPTNSISEHAEVQADPPPHSEMESLLASSGLRHRYMSQCQASPPPPNGSPQFGAKLTRSRSCPSSQLPIHHDDSASLSETTSSSNEDLSSKCLSLSLWPNSPEPRKPKDIDTLDEKTPAEILEDHMKACSVVVLRENDQQSSNSFSSSKEQSAIEDLQKKLTYTEAHSVMLYVELMYDRHRKEIHIERNRRLLEKAKRIIQLEEKNAAMSGEVKEVREELIAKTKKIAELQKLLDVRKAEMQEEVSRILAKDYSQAEEYRRLINEKNDVMVKNAEQKSSLEAANADINTLGSSLHEAKLHLDNARLKAEELIAYREKCKRLEQELITLQEMYQRLEEISRTGASDCGQVFNSDELAKELKQCKVRLEHRKQESDAACDRYKAEQGRAEKAEKQIRDMRKHLHQVEMNSVEQIRAKDDHIVALRKSHERLQVCVLQLHGKLDEADAFQDQGNRYHDMRNGQGRDSASVNS